MDGAREDLERLAIKYRLLARLRREKAAGAPPPPKATFVALADEFPGALRELDALPLDEIDRRAAALERAARTGDESSVVEPWMTWLAAWHRTLRAALAVKRRLRNGGAPSTERMASLVALASDLAALPLDEAFVLAVARPPRGRLEAVVEAELVRRLGPDGADSRPRRRRSP